MGVSISNRKGTEKNLTLPFFHIIWFEIFLQGKKTCIEKKKPIDYFLFFIPQVCLLGKIIRRKLIHQKFFSKKCPWGVTCLCSDVKHQKRGVWRRAPGLDPAAGASAHIWLCVGQVTCGGQVTRGSSEVGLLQLTFHSCWEGYSKCMWMN